MRARLEWQAVQRNRSTSFGHVIAWSDLLAKIMEIARTTSIQLPNVRFIAFGAVVQAS